MKRLISLLVLMVLFAGVSLGDWIEPYASGCANTGYWGALNCTSLTNTGAASVGSLYFGSSARNIDDGTYAIAVSTDLAVSGDVTISETLGVTGVATFTAAPINSSGKYGYTSSAGNTLYHVILATTMAAGSSVDLTLANGKIGKFSISISTTYVSGSFTAAGVITLDSASGTETSTTLNSAGKINVSDGGTVPRVDNAAFATAVAFIEYWYIN